MKAGKFLPIVLAVCGLTFWPLPAKAIPITIQIEAIVDSVMDEDNYLEGKINPGDTITGWYTYESTVPDSSPADPVQGNYWHYSPPAGISLTVGGFEFKTDQNNVEFSIFIRNNNPSDDIYGINSRNNLPLPNGTSVESIWWQLNDHTATALSSDVLPTTPPILEQWQANVLTLETDRTFLITAHVTSAVPEPATFLLLGLGGIMLRKRN